MAVTKSIRIASREKRLKAQLELKKFRCELNHNDGLSREPVDYIYQRFEEFDVYIPVCAECITKLASDDWILLFCRNCMESLWLPKPSSNRQHSYPAGEHIRFMDKCPHCFNQFEKEEK